MPRPAVRFEVGLWRGWLSNTRPLPSRRICDSPLPHPRATCRLLCDFIARRRQALFAMARGCAALATGAVAVKQLPRGAVEHAVTRLHGGGQERGALRRSRR